MTPSSGEVDADILVVGAGAAGLSAALAAAGGVAALSGTPEPSASSVRSRGRPDSSVLLLTRGHLGRDGASPLAQGGVAAALDSGDSAELHALDTVLAGAGLSREDRVAILTTEGPGRVRELIGLGARFDRDASGSLELAMEGAHSRRRVIHARGDRTGAEVTQVLSRAIRRLPSITILEEIEAEELLTEGGRVCGLRVRRSDGSAGALRADAVVLATGGLCHLYLRTTTPRSTTGDGIAMAMRAGAAVADMEFVQFHPTAMAVDSDPLPLVTEALRGEGARLVDASGRGIDFPDESGELSPRDVVARVLWDLTRAGGEVFLDARDTPGADFPDRFPGVFSLCRRHGIDPRESLIPVTPAAHYHMGGIEVDEEGRTTLPGLWAAGEVASTGVHGANRLASNSLLEGLVFGARAGASARRGLPAETDEGDGRRPANRDRVVSPGPDSISAPDTPEAGRNPGKPDEAALEADMQSLRAILWERVGVVRDAGGLREAIDAIDQLAERTLPDSVPGRRLRNALQVARQIAVSALAREESRGSHFRRDFPITRTAATP
ncbi:MAG: L-aspartate oxidase [Gemmatimonadales bacterium]|nr:MAG: L-aspartate oxidase [Gemmatimonadales bacterium]